MTALVFVDTNVLVYQLDGRDPGKQARAQAWLEHLWSTRNGRVSFQVLAELYVTLTRKLAPGLDTDTARKVVRTLAAWQPLTLDDTVFTEAWAVQDRFGLSWWDSLIVAAARVASCSYLLTEDLQHDQELDGLRVIDPSRVPPSAIRPHR
jgi:predicted nucleic acid-binding protein